MVAKTRVSVRSFEKRELGIVKFHGTPMGLANTIPRLNDGTAPSVFLLQLFFVCGKVFVCLINISPVVIEDEVVELIKELRIVSQCLQSVDFKDIQETILLNGGIGSKENSNSFASCELLLLIGENPNRFRSYQPYLPIVVSHIFQQVRVSDLRPTQLPYPDSPSGASPQWVPFRR